MVGIFRQAGFLTFDIRNTVLQTVRQLQVYIACQIQSGFPNAYLNLFLVQLAHIKNHTDGVQNKIHGAWVQCSVEVNSWKTLQVFRNDILLIFLPWKLERVFENSNIQHNDMCWEASGSSHNLHQRALNQPNKHTI